MAWVGLCLFLESLFIGPDQEPLMLVIVTFVHTHQWIGDQSLSTLNSGPKWCLNKGSKDNWHSASALDWLNTSHIFTFYYIDNRNGMGVRVRIHVCALMHICFHVCDCVCVCECIWWSDPRLTFRGSWHEAVLSSIRLPWLRVTSIFCPDGSH